MTNYLEHYGVKGMKWGIRKDPPSSNADSIRSTSTSKRSSVPQTERKENARIVLARDRALRNTMLYIGSNKPVKIMEAGWIRDPKANNGKGQNYYLNLDENGRATSFRTDGGYTSTYMHAMIDAYNELVNDIEFEEKKKEKKKPDLTKDTKTKVSQLSNNVRKKSLKKVQNSKSVSKGQKAVDSIFKKRKTAAKKSRR